FPEESRPSVADLELELAHHRDVWGVCGLFGAAIVSDAVSSFARTAIGTGGCFQPRTLTDGEPCHGRSLIRPAHRQTVVHRPARLLTARQGFGARRLSAHGLQA